LEQELESPRGTFFIALSGVAVWEGKVIITIDKARIAFTTAQVGGTIRIAGCHAHFAGRISEEPVASFER
jgi:hypothetical protein